MQFELVGFQTVPGADEIRIPHRDLRFVIDIVMDTFARVGGPVGLRASGRGLVDPHDTERRQILVAPGILSIVLGEIVNVDALPAPLRVQTFGDVPHADRVATAIVDQDDVSRPVRLVAAADVRQKGFERGGLHTDGAGIDRMAGWFRIDVAFGHEPDDRCCRTERRHGLPAKRVPRSRGSGAQG